MGIGGKTHDSTFFLLLKTKIFKKFIKVKVTKKILGQNQKKKRAL
jgi:hypothetical protein